MLDYQGGKIVSNEFIEALKNKDIIEIRKIPKADLHNHAILGGNLSYFENLHDKKIDRLNKKLESIEEMESWVGNNFLPLIEGVNGFEKAIEAAFLQAKSDGVKVLQMSIDVYFRYHYNGSVDQLINVLKDIHMKFAPEIDFKPELGLNRSVSTDILMEWFEPYMEHNYFKSIDLYGNEFAQPIGNFKKIYSLAKGKGLILKAHVGEFGEAYSIKEAVEELELNQVQHGISAVKSVDIMKWLAENKIQLNICPTSNVMLNRVRNYKEHPIKTLYRNGVKVTINTDDVIVFNQGVSEEFINLYENGVLTAEELDEIRNNGLRE